MTTLFLLEAMRENDKTLVGNDSGFYAVSADFGQRQSQRKIPFEEVAEIAEAAAEIENELGDKGRLLLRYSGTENLARVMIEGENQTEIEKQANHLAEIIKKSLEK